MQQDGVWGGQPGPGTGQRCEPTEPCASTACCALRGQVLPSILRLKSCRNCSMYRAVLPPVPCLLAASQGFSLLGTSIFYPDAFSSEAKAGPFNMHDKQQALKSTLLAAYKGCGNKISHVLEVSHTYSSRGVPALPVATTEETTPCIGGAAAGGKGPAASLGLCLRVSPAPSFLQVPGQLAQ